MDKATGRQDLPTGLISPHWGGACCGTNPCGVEFFEGLSAVFPTHPTFPFLAGENHFLQILKLLAQDGHSALAGQTAVNESVMNE